MQSSQSFLALGHLHPCGYLRSLTGAGNPLAQAYHRAPAPRRTALPPPGLLLRHFLRENIILGGIGLHLGLGHVAFACAADTTKLATPGTCGCIFAAALLLPNQGQTNALDQPPHKRRGMALAKPPSLFFNVQNVQKNDRYLFYSILLKIPAEIWCQNILQDISPKYQERYFAKISRKIFCQNIPKDILPEYPTRYFARISHQIFCQNIPPNSLPEYPARYFGKILPTRYLAKIATRILRRQSASPFWGPNQKVSRGDGPGETIVPWQMDKLTEWGMLSSYHPRKCVLTGFPNARQQTATVHCLESYLYHGWHPFRGWWSGWNHRPWKTFDVNQQGVMQIVS